MLWKIILALLFIALCVKIWRSFKNMPLEARRRLAREAERSSFLNPKNLPRGRYRDGAIG